MARNKQFGGNNTYIDSFSENMKSNKFLMCVITSIALALFIIFSIGVLYIANKDTNASLSMQYFYLGLLLIPLIIIFGAILQLWTSDNIGSDLMFLLGTISIIIGLVFIYTHIGSKYLNIISNIFGVLLLLIILVGLTIFSAIFLNNAKKSSSWLGFIVNFIFYIPCLLSDFVSYLSREYIVSDSI